MNRIEIAVKQQRKARSGFKKYKGDLMDPLYPKPKAKPQV